MKGENGTEKVMRFKAHKHEDFQTQQSYQRDIGVDNDKKDENAMKGNYKI